MSPEAMKQMADVSRRIKNPVDIRLHIGDDPRSQELATFCRELSQQIPAIRISEQTTDEAAAMPGMQIGTSIIYQGVPQGTETGAFLDVLQKVSEQDTPAIQTGRETGWDIPSMLRLYVSGMCTFCPREVQKLTALVLQQTGLRLTIIDAMQFPELAKADAIRSLPTLILDDQFRWTGSVDRRELMDTVQNRDPAQLSPATLEAVIADVKEAAVDAREAILARQAE